MSFAGKTEGLITKEEILGAKTLLIDKDASPVFSIKSFKMTLICKGWDILEFENMTGELSLAMIENIEKAENECKLFFEYIRIENNKTHLIIEKLAQPLSFTLN